MYCTALQPDEQFDCGIVSESKAESGAGAQQAQLVSSHGEECKTLFKEAAWHSIYVSSWLKVRGWQLHSMAQHSAACATFQPNRGSYNSGQSEAGSCSATQHITTSLQIQTSA